MPRIVIFAEARDWHGRRLTQALRASGATVATRSLAGCGFALGGAGPGIVIPNEAELPDAVLVKTVASGSFEQVTLRLSLLHALDRLGVIVINDARAIERCVDKAMTSFLLHRAGIPIPSTLATEDGVWAAQAIAASKTDLVQKPLFGSQGRDLARIAPGGAPPPAEPYAGVHYLQQFVGRESGWQDYRVMVVGGTPVAAMQRRGASWITNVHRGARCEAVEMSRGLAELSIGAVEAVGADYAGVDLIEDPAGGLRVLEVNSMPAWRGLQSVADCDIAERLARHVLARLG
jgi:RimK family alpha-L-glutamate ligase